MHTAPDLPLLGLPADSEVAFCYQPDAEARAALVHAFDLQSLKKTRLEGRMIPEGQSDWRLEAKLGATVVQTCVVTLTPVTTRIDVPVTRRYLAYMEPVPDAGEIEMPEDDTIEPQPGAIDLHAVFAEALALALPDFPRAPDASLENHTFTEPGKAPLSDADIKPFAALKALRDSQSGPDDNTE